MDNTTNNIDEQLYRTRIELTNSKDIAEFTDICYKIEEDVIVRGLDENGNEWCLSAKSLFCSLMMSAKIQQNRLHNAHEVDWNTIYVECEKDIYYLISKFAK